MTKNKKKAKSDFNDDLIDDENVSLDEFEDFDDENITEEDIEESEEIIKSGEEFFYSSNISDNRGHPIFDFLRNTSGQPLLTAEEEIELAKKIKRGREPEKTNAINTLVERNLRLVIYNARVYNFPGVELDDLIQEGTIGLIRAANKFDYTKKFRFATYATWWIKQSITRNAPAQSRNIRIPSHMITKKNLAKRIANELVQDGSREPSYEEIANASDGKLTAEQVKTIMENTSDTLSFETFSSQTEDNDEINMLDFVDFGQGNSVEDALFEKEVDETLYKLVSFLTPREKMIVTMRYGLFGESQMNVRELSEVYGITRERIRQIAKESLTKMLKKAKEKGIECPTFS